MGRLGLIIRNRSFRKDGKLFKIFCTCFAEPIEIYLTADSMDDAYVIAVARLSKKLKMKKEFVHNRIDKNPRDFRIAEFDE